MEPRHIACPESPIQPTYCSEDKIVFDPEAQKSMKQYFQGRQSVRYEKIDFQQNLPHDKPLREPKNQSNIETKQNRSSKDTRNRSITDIHYNQSKLKYFLLVNFEGQDEKMKIYVYNHCKLQDSKKIIQANAKLRSRDYYGHGNSECRT